MKVLGIATQALNTHVHVSTTLVYISVVQDVLELLEKRVKSRFSHRQIHLLSKLSFKGYLEAVCAQLSLPQDFPDPCFAQDWNASIKVGGEGGTVANTLWENML